MRKATTLFCLLVSLARAELAEIEVRNGIETTAIYFELSHTVDGMPTETAGVLGAGASVLVRGDVGNSPFVSYWEKTDGTFSNGSGTAGVTFAKGFRPVVTMYDAAGGPEIGALTGTVGPLTAGAPLSVEDQLAWLLYGFVFLSVPSAVALMVRMFRASGGGGEV